MSVRGTQASKVLGMFSSLAWVPGTQEFVLLFFTLHTCMLYTFLNILYVLYKKKKDGVCPDSALFLYPIPALVLSWQRGGQGPSSQFLSVSEGGQRTMGGEGLPSAAGPRYSRVGRPGGSRARRGRLALLSLPTLRIRPGLWPTCCFTHSA